MSTPQKMSRRVKWLLMASLALNLLFVGVFVGAALRLGGDRGPGGARMGSYGVPYLQALPKAERRALHDALRSDGVLPSKEARRALYQGVLDGLRADPFAPEILSRVITQQGQRMQDVQGTLHAKWLEAVTAMSAGERLTYADALEDRLSRKRRYSRHKDKR